MNYCIATALQLLSAFTVAAFGSAGFCFALFLFLLFGMGVAQDVTIYLEEAATSGPSTELTASGSLWRDIHASPGCGGILGIRHAF